MQLSSFRSGSQWENGTEKNDTRVTKYRGLKVKERNVSKPLFITQWKRNGNGTEQNGKRTFTFP